MIRGTQIAVKLGTKLVGGVGDLVLTHLGTQLSLVEPATGTVRATRDLGAVKHVRICGDMLVVVRGEDTFLRIDLTGDELAWPVDRPFSLAAAADGIALFSNFETRVRVDLTTGLTLDTVRDPNRWSWLDPRTGLVLGTHRSTITALRIADGTIAWTAEAHATKLDNLGVSLLPWANAIGMHATSRGTTRFTALDARTGAVIDGVRNLAVEAAARSTNHPQRISDGVVVLDSDQATVVRPFVIARVALPYLEGRMVVADRIVGIATIDERSELVSVPLPGEGDHDLELVPVGDDLRRDDEPGIVSFAGMTILTVQHPTHGKITVTRRPTDAPIEVGTEVMVEGITPKLGGGSNAARWWLPTKRRGRSARVVQLGAPPIAHEVRVEPPLDIVKSLRERAAEVSVPIPKEVVTFLELVERDRELRDTLRALGLHFELAELGIEVLDALAVEGFVPIWGNGFGDGFGGLLSSGEVAKLYTDDRVPRPLTSIASYVRSEAETSELEATADYAVRALERAGF